MDDFPDFLDPFQFLGLVFGLLVILMARYFLVAGLFQLFFNVWNNKKWSHRKLSSNKIPVRQYYVELKWSVVTSLIFAVVSAFAIVIWQKGYTKVYVSLSDYGWIYLPVSLALYMLLHETYYYFLHRWMHRPAVFKLIHKTHHASKTTSAWTAFSFHPIEGFLQAIILPITILLIPIHIYVLLLLLVIMTFSSAINHLEIEIYPAWFQNNFLGKWIIGATHHSLHHKQFKYNFGLYFTFWDKIKKTESPLYGKLFSEKTLAGNAE